MCSSGMKREGMMNKNIKIGITSVGKSSETEGELYEGIHGLPRYSDVLVLSQVENIWC